MTFESISLSDDVIRKYNAMHKLHGEIQEAKLGITNRAPHDYQTYQEQKKLKHKIRRLEDRFDSLIN